MYTRISLALSTPVVFVRSLHEYFTTLETLVCTLHGYIFLSNKFEERVRTEGPCDKYFASLYVNNSGARVLCDEHTGNIKLARPGGAMHSIAALYVVFITCTE